MDWKSVKTKLFWWGTGVLTGFALAADVALARSIDPSKAGVTLWIFLVVGAFIILLQLIPAIILFISFVATGHHIMPVKKEVEVKEAAKETA